MIVYFYCIFAALCGWLEAILYARRAAESFDYNEHIGMTLQRIGAALLVPASLWLYYQHGSYWYATLQLVPAGLLFPLVHDEAYNFTRLWLKWAEFYQSEVRLMLPGRALPTYQPDIKAFRRAVAEYRYGYQSPTTTARFDFNGKQRTWLAVSGLLLWAVGAWWLL